MSAEAQTVWPTPAQRLMRRLGFDRTEGHTLRGRAWAMSRERDWSHRLMVAVGTAWCGNYDPPFPRSLYYRMDNDGRLRTLRRYGEMDEAPAAHDYWKVAAVNNDGFELMLGTPERWGFYGANRKESLRLAWFVVWDWWVVADWFGLRRWIYYKALHRAVNRQRRLVTGGSS